MLRRFLERQTVYDWHTASFQGRNNYCKTDFSGIYVLTETSEEPVWEVLHEFPSGSQRNGKEMEDWDTAIGWMMGAV